MNSNRVKRVAVSLMMAGVAATGVASVAATSASAATLQNTVHKTYNNWSDCLTHQKMDNWGKYPQGGDQYFYCADGANGQVNEWWRHYM
jgi:hypothetical protein